MSENENISEVISLVEEAQKRGKFNLADAIKGRSLPEKKVDVYIDEVSAFNLYELNKKMDEAALKADVNLYNKLQDEAIELAEKVMDSKLTFHMVGLPQSKIDEIGDRITGAGDPTDMSWSKDYICSLVAASIKSVENSKGEVDEHEFTFEEGQELYLNLPKESWAKLVDTVEQLTLASGIFKGITDAGFLQKS